MHIASNEARATSVVALRITILPLAQCGYGNSMPMGIKCNLLLLCVAEQYRGAVELCETEGLRKSTWVIIIFTPMFHNLIKPLAIRQFVESRRSRLVAGTDKRLIYGVFLTPSPCGTSPISLRSQGQKRLLYGLRGQTR